jgi:hypothetical protein
MQFRGVTLLPRQRGENGHIRTCEIYVSDNGTDWGKPIAKAELSKDKELKTIPFDKAYTARYLKLVALNGFEDQPWATLAEIDVTQ